MTSAHVAFMCLLRLEFIFSGVKGPFKILGNSSEQINWIYFQIRATMFNVMNASD